MKTYNHFINGVFVEPSSGQWFDSENPYSGEVWAKIPLGNADDVNAAVKAAKSAFEGEWRAFGPTARGKLLVRLAEIAEREAERLGEIEVQDKTSGLPILKNDTNNIIEFNNSLENEIDKYEKKRKFWDLLKNK